MINYSIIIPHKDIPQLLQRCLDSIPQRMDLEVIVVDDNSNPNIVDFDDFPGNDRNDVKVIFTKEGEGAGYARNVGLESAIGKWLLFFDADDYATQEFDELLNQNIDSDADIIFFRPRAVMSDDPQKESRRANWYNIIYEQYASDKDETLFRTRWLSTWSKMIRHQLIKEKSIRFDEIPYSNDNYFSVSVGCAANKIKVIDDCFYVLTERPVSLMTDFLNKPGELESRALGFLHASQVVAKSQYAPDEWWLFNFATRLYSVNNILFIVYVKFIHKECNISRISIYRRIFSNIERKEKIMKFIKCLWLEFCHTNISVEKYDTFGSVK